MISILQLYMRRGVMNTEERAKKGGDLLNESLMFE